MLKNNLYYLETVTSVPMASFITHFESFYKSIMVWIIVADSSR